MQPLKKLHFDKLILSKKITLFKLNRTGKHAQFHELLKKSIIRVVREKFLKKKDFEDPEAKKEFIEQLYVFLIGRVLLFLFFRNELFNVFLFAKRQKSVLLQRRRRIARLKREKHDQDFLLLAVASGDF